MTRGQDDTMLTITDKAIIDTEKAQPVSTERGTHYILHVGYYDVEEADDGAVRLGTPKEDTYRVSTWEHAMAYCKRFHREDGAPVRNDAAGYTLTRHYTCMWVDRVTGFEIIF